MIEYYVFAGIVLLSIFCAVGLVYLLAAPINFCMSNGFNSCIDENNKLYCSTDTTISDKPVDCSLFSDCKWGEPRTVVQVGGKSK